MYLVRKAKNALFDVTPKNYIKERNPWLSAFMSGFIPGLGQVYNGLTLRGLAYLTGLILILYFWLGYLYQSFIHGPDSQHPVSFWQILSNTVSVLLFFYIYIHCIMDAYATAETINKSLASTNSAIGQSLRKCKKCGYDVGSDTKKCPVCNATLKGGFRFGYIIAIIVSLISFSILYPLYHQPLNELPKTQIFHISENLEKTFNEDLEKHYKNLIVSFNSKNIDKTLEILGLFSSAGRLDYKDVQSIYMKTHIEKLQKKNSLIIESNLKEKLNIYKELLKYDQNNITYKKRLRFYENQIKLAESDLMILSRRWYLQAGFAIVEGEVENVSKKVLTGVKAIITWYDKHEKIITSDSIFIKNNPFLPGNKSNFRLKKFYNPSIKTAKIEFQDMSGNNIPTYLSEK